MQTKNYTNVLSQINDTLKVLSGLFGREVSLEELIEFGNRKTGQTKMTPALQEALESEVKVKTATKKPKKAVAKPLSTPAGQFSKNLKKVRPEANDFIISARWTGRRYTYDGVPTIEQMLDGVVVFLNFTDPNLVRKFKGKLRASINGAGFGFNTKHLAYNRIQVTLGDKQPSRRYKK